jgi:hypothetical protein
MPVSAMTGGDAPVLNVKIRNPIAYAHDRAIAGIHLRLVCAAAQMIALKLFTATPLRKNVSKLENGETASPKRLRCRSVYRARSHPLSPNGMFLQNVPWVNVL